MDERDVKKFLAEVRSGKVSLEAALERLRGLPYEDAGFAKIDHHRALRQGYPEVIFGRGKDSQAGERNREANVARESVA